RAMQDGDLTYSISADPASGDVIRSGVREWDDALASVTLTERSPGARVDIAISFTEDVGRTEGQAVTSFTQRELIRKVEITITGGRAPGNTGGLLQIAKHEFGHALGLGHTNYEGNLMSPAVSPDPQPVPPCVVQGVIEANRWKMMAPVGKRPIPPRVSQVTC
ncbi:MAG TPA: matrixin family metalloprotease, partial [Acidimicrobiia bacterium]|nr:matrixin family metalloprotease [Acidimicrobiia bacterium]